MLVHAVHIAECTIRGRELHWLPHVRRISAGRPDVSGIVGEVHLSSLIHLPDTFTLCLQWRVEQGIAKMYAPISGYVCCRTCQEQTSTTRRSRDTQDCQVNICIAHRSIDTVLLLVSEHLRRHELPDRSFQVNILTAHKLLL